MVRVVRGIPEQPFDDRHAAARENALGRQHNPHLEITLDLRRQMLPPVRNPLSRPVDLDVRAVDREESIAGTATGQLGERLHDARAPLLLEGPLRRLSDSRLRQQQIGNPCSTVE